MKRRELLLHDVRERRAEGERRTKDERRSNGDNREIVAILKSEGAAAAAATAQAGDCRRAPSVEMGVRGWGGSQGGAVRR